MFQFFNSVFFMIYNQYDIPIQYLDKETIIIKLIIILGTIVLT